MAGRTCNSKKRISNRIRQVKLARDSHGIYIPICSYKEHPGIVHNGQHKKCIKSKCKHYVRFRPSQSKKRDYTRVFRSLEELDLN